MAKRMRITSPFDWVPSQASGKPVRGMMTYQPGEHLMPDAAAERAIALGVGALVGEEPDEGTGMEASPDPASTSSPRPPELDDDGHTGWAG